MKIRRALVAAVAVALAAVAVPSVPAVAAHPTAALPPVGGPYVSPWGDAQVAWDPALKELLETRHITVTPIAPVTALPEGAGLTSAIGTTAGSYIDPVNFGRVYYQGGWIFTNTETGGSWKADDFWLRFFPTRGLSAFPEVNGVKSEHEQLFATYTLEGAALGGGGWGLDPAKVGVKTSKVPLTLTQAGADDLNRALGTELSAGDPLGILSGEFRYLPS